MEKEKLEKKETVSIEDTNISEGVKKINKKKIVLLFISAIVLILVGLLVFKFAPINSKSLKPDVAKIKAEEFINNNLMLPGTKATITEIIDEYGLYKIMVDVGSGEIIESYISQDGLLFFPQSIDMDDYNSGVEPVEASEVSTKQDKLDIELFIMSHCPYGTQMEKALLPVIEALGDNVNFQLKFNTYAMHDKVELDEQLAQYCIQKEDNSKLIPYLNCFNKSGESATCLAENNIDKNQIANCVKATDDEYKISESYADQSTWLSGTYPIFPIYQDDNEKYGVQGSPTLIINGEMVTANRDSQSLLQLACSGFTNQPTECQSQLSTVSPGYGFGE
ncbi:MAG TPA: hypothetical protein PK142_03090 [bacterium]|nr:hypothetical protein [bacterium]